jgi:SAM-dependent methyltransferase
MNLQEKANKFSEVFLGGPTDCFESIGRLQLITLLELGLYPDSKVLDIGCGCLRGGYWLIHFLQNGCYFGIEPNEEMLNFGLSEFMEEETIQTKTPQFDFNCKFDASVFNQMFDFFIARSVWTHASKNQIEQMLDSFCRNSTQNATFVTSYHRATNKQNDYMGDDWVGRSHNSSQSSSVRHSFEWIQEACYRRELLATEYKQEIEYRQTWLKIIKQQNSGDSDE